LSLREPHTFIDRHCGIMPRSTVIGVFGRGYRAVRKRACDGRARLGLERQKAGKEAVEPRALLERERRGLGDHGVRSRRECPLDRHTAASLAIPSIIALSALRSCLRVKAWKVSSP